MYDLLNSVWYKIRICIKPQQICSVHICSQKMQIKAQEKKIQYTFAVEGIKKKRRKIWKRSKVTCLSARWNQF